MIMPNTPQPSSISIADLVGEHITDLQVIRGLLLNILVELRGPHPVEAAPEANARPSLVQSLMNAHYLTLDIRGMAMELRESLVGTQAIQPQQAAQAAGLGGQWDRAMQGVSINRI